MKKRTEILIFYFANFRKSIDWTISNWMQSNENERIAEFEMQIAHQRKNQCKMNVSIGLLNLDAVPEQHEHWERRKEKEKHQQRRTHQTSI